MRSHCSYNLSVVNPFIKFNQKDIILNRGIAQTYPSTGKAMLFNILFMKKIRCLKKISIYFSWCYLFLLMLIIELPIQLLALGIADLISISIKRLASFGITPFFHGFLWVRFFKTSATPQTYPQNHDILSDIMRLQ